MRTLLLVVALAAASIGHPWACFHGDSQHSGRSSSTFGSLLVRTAAYSTGGEVSGSPAVREDGAVLVGARDVKLYCFDASLNLIWLADLSAHGTSIYFSAPALDDSGNAYILTSRKLVKVSRSGSVLWAWPSHNSLSVSHSAVIGQDGKIYFACYSDSLYALTPDGNLAWAADLGASVNSSPAVGPDGRIYVGTTRGTSGWKLWCFNPDGTSPWSFDLADGADFASPAVGPDTVIYIGAGHYLYAVNGNGTLRWRDSLSAQVQSCPAIANESTLYVVAGARLYCVDTDASVRWQTTIGGSNYCSPAVDAQGQVFVGSANGAASTFFCIGPDSTVLDSYVVGDDIWSSPAIGAGTHGRIYFGCMNDTLYFFTGTGAGVAGAESRPTVAEPRVWPNPTRRWLHVGDGAVRLLDCCGRQMPVNRTGELLDLGAVSRGLYLLETTVPGQERYQKVVRD